MIRASNAKRRQLVVGNWKMNGSLRANSLLLKSITAQWQGHHNTDVVICPAFPHIAQIAHLLAGTELMVGAQTVSEFEQGAYTGEVSASMLADLDCKFVIIGHNERRRMQGESDEQIAEKFVRAQNAGLVPIFCVGESLEDRNKSLHLTTISRQLDAVFNRVDKSVLQNAVLAYEPVWAVGTGKTATPNQADEVHKFMRMQLGDCGEDVKILYGGSVRSHNAKELFALNDIDGALLGGASLDADEFLAICKAADDCFT